MKWKTISILLSIFAINSILLRKSEQDQKELDSKTVKSPGGFDNIAPEAKKIVTPEYAKPKVDVNLNIKSTGLVTRTVDLGTTAVPKVGKVFDPSTGTFDNVAYVENKKIVGTTTTWAPTETIHNVQIDIQSGKAIPALNSATQPKKNHGVEPSK